MLLPDHEVFDDFIEPKKEKPSLLDYRRDDQPETTPEEDELTEFELKTDQPTFTDSKTIKEDSTWL